MRKVVAPHEKLTDDEIKSEIENLLKNILILREYLVDNEVINEVYNSSEDSIFKLRRHFSPEKNFILKVSISELSDLMGNGYAKR